MTQSGAWAYLAVFVLMALAIAAFCVVLSAQYYRRRRGRRFADRASTGEAGV